MRPNHFFSKNQISQAKKYLESDCIEEIVFSGPTYQVHVKDETLGEQVWTFLKFNDNRELQDMFCSCEEWEQNGDCWHTAISYLKIIEKNGKPLHEFFEESFWNALGKVWFSHFGLKKPKMKEDIFEIQNWKFKSLSSSFKTMLEELIKDKEQTEETSIKFTNLSDEFIEAWRKGNPPTELSYELSVWSDLAKQLFLIQDKASLSIEFISDKDKLPEQICIKGKDFELIDFLNKKDWTLLIPTLNEISSNLKTYNRLIDQLESIEYNPESASLNLFPKKNIPHPGEGEEIGDWIYKKKAFYPIYQKNESIRALHNHEITLFFKQYHDEIEPLLKGCIWHKKPIQLQTSLSFDDNWNLHIEKYVTQEGDLIQEQSQIWGQWIFIPKKGFFTLVEPLKENISLTIPEDEVPEFIRTHTPWLNQQPGFLVHIGSLETEIAYKVDKFGNLSFERKFAPSQKETKEFGQWIYLKGEGFFNKVHTPLNLPLHLGIPLREEQVVGFLRRNRNELALIPGFFTDKQIVEEVGLDIRLQSPKKIFIQPKVILKTEFQDIPFRKYDEWIYFEGIGFYELPIHQRLPEKYHVPFWVGEESFKSFIINELPTLKKWILFIDPKLNPPLTLQLKLNSIEKAPFHSWEIHLHYETEKGKIELEQIKEGQGGKKSYLFTKAGRLDLWLDRFQWLKKLRPEAWSKEGKLTLSTIELMRLNAFEEIEPSEKAFDLFNEVINLKKVPEFNPKALQSTLRPYQEKGAHWLFSIYHYLLGGLLCDEMGLGKTHQAMALMAAILNEEVKGQFLVVCPTSVLYHWEEKLKSFFPSLKVLTFHGPFRKKDIEGEFNLLLTSYGILRNEGPWFNEKRFNVAIYDEIQVAKNHRSKMYAALQKVNADVKIGLTGTPIENKLRELKTLFDLVLPGYMPNETDYQRLIVKPIEVQRDMKQRNLLHRLTKPFILRRRKEDVLKDLPEKNEEISYCDMQPMQAQIYKEVLLFQRDELLKVVLDNSKQLPYLHIFALLSRLKQICNHPALYYKQPQEYKKYSSGKWDLFVELLQEARESEQKVVVYSQYLGMLDIIEHYLTEHGIGFASLRGSTTDRKGQIELFAKEPSCEVFVASLKAAGLGIDLTSASVVIHYDRWWNAARENQATDRVHRYGQSRGVQVFKLVTKKTFEERIHQIIERKRELMEEAIGVDDHEILKSFSREEIYQLLQMQE